MKKYKILVSAYARATKRSGYHTRHMDNVKARYLIKHSITLSDINEAMKELVEAHEILIKQMRTEKSDAPYKVAQQYLNFYNDKKRQFDFEKNEKLMNMSSDVLEYISNLNESVQKEKAM
jgi:hypothetical protein